MSVSRRLRYEVLRRDNFACRYCGGSAPDVKLTVDHVQPVSLGGSDDASNLVTACQECNAGKSSAAPDAPLVQGVADDALRWAAAMKRAAEIQAEERASVAEFCEGFSKAWGTWYSLPSDWERTIEGWFNAGVEKDFLCDCIDIAFAAKGVSWRWKYFCGVVWRRLDERYKIASDLITDEEGEDDGR
jgi:hypothetical protein